MTSLCGAMKTVKWGIGEEGSQFAPSKTVFNTNKEPGSPGIKLKFYYNFIHHKLLVFL